MQSVMDAVIQLIVFAIIPFVYWLMKFRKERRFTHWIGLRKMHFQNKTRALIYAVICFTVLLISGILLLSFIEDKTLVANAHFSALSLQVVFAILVYSIVQTGLAEELFFRGVLLKIFFGWWGFREGNIIQSLIFGLLHAVILVTFLNPFIIIFIFIFSASAGWLMGYLNESLGKGSILPSWLIHSLVNITSSFMLLLNIL